MTRSTCPGLRRTPGKKAQRAFTLIEMIVAVAIAASIGVAVVTSMNSQIASTKKNQCMANLQMIESAKNAWVGDHPGQTMPTPPFTGTVTDPLVPYLRGGNVPSCPSLPSPSPSPSATPTYTNVYDPTNATKCTFHNQQAY
ncbi:MAG TPA: type II secretion system protein [Chthoniobacterales bacterium]